MVAMSFEAKQQHSHVYSTIIYNGQDIETPYVSTDE